MFSSFQTINKVRFAIHIKIVLIIDVIVSWFHISPCVSYCFPPLVASCAIQVAGTVLAPPTDCASCVLSTCFMRTAHVSLTAHLDTTS